MPWTNILAAVDDSHEAATAAGVAWDLAQNVDARYHLVHAVGSDWLPTGGARSSDIEQQQIAAALGSVRKTLGSKVSGEVVSRLTGKPGRAARVIEDTCHQIGADLVVLGGKRHSVLSRWFGGSTAHQVARTCDVPLLVTGDSPASIRKILVAVDLSYAAGPTIQMAQRAAGALDASLRVIHVVTPLRGTLELPVHLKVGALEDEANQHLEEHVWPLVDGDAEKVVLRGPLTTTVSYDAIDWRADLLFVGSHGKGRVDRLLLGSFTESMLNDLPTSLLVVPVPPPPPPPGI